MAAISATTSSASGKSLSSFAGSVSLFDPPTRQSTGVSSVPAEDVVNPNATCDAPFVSRNPQDDGASATLQLLATDPKPTERGEGGRGFSVDPARLVSSRRLLQVDEPDVPVPTKPMAALLGPLKRAFVRQEKYTEHRRVFFPTLSTIQTKGQSEYGRHRYRYGRAYSFTVLQNMHADKESLFSTYLALQASRGQRDTRLRVALRIYEAVIYQSSEHSKGPVESTAISIARRERRVYERLGKLEHVAKQYLLDAFGCLKSGDYFVFVTPAQHCTLHEVLSGKVKLDIKPDPTLLPRAWVAQLVIGLSVLHEQGVIHRNLSPRSIFVTHEGQLKIGNYDSAFVDNDWSPLVPRRGYAFRPHGSSDYCAPEMYRLRERHGQADVSRSMDADETNHNGIYYGYGKEVDVWSLGCVIAEILRNPREPRKVLFERAVRFGRYVNGNRDVQFGMLENFIKTNNHFRVGLVYQLLHIEPQLRMSLENIPSHPFFAFWLEDKPRFPNGRRIKRFNDIATYKPFALEDVPLVKAFNLEHEPVEGHQAYITAWAEKPNGHTPTLNSLDNYTWVNPAEPLD